MASTENADPPIRPVLLVGGSGAVGRAAILWFRRRHHRAPVIIGVLSAQRAKCAAKQADGVLTVVLDADLPGLGVEENLKVSAVVMLVPDRGAHGQRFAHDRSIPYLSIADTLLEIGPSTALFARRSRTSAVVLGSHWAAGAGVFLALDAAERFEQVSSVRIAALLDDDDLAGSTVPENMNRLDVMDPAVMAFEDDRMTWRDSSSPGIVEAIDGRRVPTHAYSPFDVIGVRAETDAPDVRFDLATGISSRRASGGDSAAEIIVEVTGRSEGATTRVRSTLEFPSGHASLTGLVAALTVSAAIGLEEASGLRPGLYFPETVAEPGWFLNELRAAGATIASSIQAQG